MSTGPEGQLRVGPRRSTRGSRSGEAERLGQPTDLGPAMERQFRDLQGGGAFRVRAGARVVNDPLGSA